MKQGRFFNQTKRLQNSRGFLSADFLFSMVIAAGLCVVLFSLTFTLSMVEVSQYIAFSVSRAHAAAHKTQDDQENMATRKFAALSKNKILAPLFQNEWFSLGALDIRGGGAKGKSFADRYPKGAANSQFVPQNGIRLTFESKLLKVKVPMIGSTDDGNGFKSFVTGLMFREPSAAECLTQIRAARFGAILSLDTRFAKIVGNSAGTFYVPMEDNGC